MSFKKCFMLVLIAVSAGALSLYRTAPVEGQFSAFANFEGAQTSPIRLSPDGTLLFAVNTANASLSVFDVSSPTSPVLVREIPVGLEPVSVNPRTNDEVWVVNQLSDSVSVVSVAAGMVIATLQVSDEPMDVVFAGDNQAYVSVSRRNAIVVYDVLTRTPVRALPLVGGNPRALAVSPDRSRVYAAFALSGNASTVIRSDHAPPQPPPTNPSLPPPPQVSKIVDSRDPAWGSIVTFRMPDNDVAVIAAEPFPFVAQYVSGVGTVNLGLAVSPANGDVFVANTEARNLVQFEPNLRGHWVDNRITRIEIASGSVTPFDLNPGIDYSILPNPAARATALAQPTAVEFDPSGAFMYVAAFGTDRVARVDTNGQVLSFVEVSPVSGSGSRVDPRTKRGPRGLALSPNGQTLYVLNRIANTISVVDTDRNLVARELRVGRDATPLVIRLGRGFLYDAKLSGNGTGSCASCHVDADMDMLAWDLGNPGGEMSSFRQGDKVIEFHPMKGPMTTQTLRGLAQMAPLHWRGDRVNFMQFAGAFEALMGGTAPSEGDMLTFTLFVNTLLFQPNPNQNLDRTLPSSLLQGNPNTGREIYLTVPLTRPGVTCNTCHLMTPGPGSNRLIVTQQEQPLKVPQLRNAYQKLGYNRFLPSTIDGFGMNHDGPVSTLLDFFNGQAFVDYSVEQKKHLAAFVLAFDTGTAPAVGRAITLTRATVNDPERQSNWAILEGQATLRASDLVVHGTLNGQLQKLTFRPLSSDYTVDAFPAIALSRNQLIAIIERGDTLTVMGVPPFQGLTPTASVGLPVVSERHVRRLGH